LVILQRDNAGLTKIIAAKAERKQLTRRVLSTGTGLMHAQVHKAREKKESEKLSARRQRIERGRKGASVKEKKREGKRGKCEGMAM
jgi:hypothetical protein